jgi:hypothetical protein
MRECERPERVEVIVADWLANGEADGGPDAQFDLGYDYTCGPGLLDRMISVLSFFCSFIFP